MRMIRKGPIAPVDTGHLSTLLTDHGATGIKVRLDPHQNGYGVLDKITFQWNDRRWAVQFIARDAGDGYLLVHGNGVPVNRGPQEDSDGMQYDFGEILQTLDTTHKEVK
tara:strand:+ start:204 stop:530 length:327 start_codon:yes stop_codon:yes gene_type:complete